MPSSETQTSDSPTPPASAPTSAPAAALTVAVLALLTAVAPLAIDMYLPAFPQMATELGAGASQIQLTLTACLLGLALGQLFVGPLSDTTGRRRPLLVGSLICVLAGIACALAPTAELLAVARFVQGLSGAVGVVLARAVVSDTARGPAAAKLLGVLMIISVIAPVVAPLSGGAIIATLGWRAVFWVLAALALVMFLGVLAFVPESLPASARTRGGIRTTLRGAGEALANRTYLGYLLTFCFSFAALFAYIAASPFVMQSVMGLSAGQYSLLFGLNALVITATSAVAAALAGRVAYRRMIMIGLTVGVVVAAGLLVAVVNGVPLVPTLVLFAVFQGSMGFIFANATTLALAETGHNAGTGSAFLGFLQFLLAAAVAPLVGIMGEQTAVPMALAMVVSIVLAVLAFAVLTRAQPAPAAGDGTTEPVEATG
ncbi:MFS transporter, DHA1 family, bicyclomycin/chloramphenicol resistance protein [Pseudonocardia ammonioxydans]|uniref:MFS transporter, DHA1 family, bicyclomycin/chloramphenicol resistance protein n=1 Tax=Pseudonocardia ammonioxydans TaxID=260086 RepID=A0A1I4V8E2_PSUAM|nr:multidrug effflux MFS transporter [Pseudonocardia ammonioxydans]SFM97499.1 MFS transporter, DHA1 family, bicyclomycin/chloramphenicol resistance protein [Pseudonocardia ammonioxydans]